MGAEVRAESGPLAHAVVPTVLLPGLGADCAVTVPDAAGPWWLEACDPGAPSLHLWFAPPSFPVDFRLEAGPPASPPDPGALPFLVFDELDGAASPPWLEDSSDGYPFDADAGGLRCRDGVTCQLTAPNQLPTAGGVVHGRVVAWVTADGPTTDGQTFELGVGALTAVDNPTARVWASGSFTFESSADSGIRSDVGTGFVPLAAGPYLSEAAAFRVELDRRTRTLSVDGPARAELADDDATFLSSLERGPLVLLRGSSVRLDRLFVLDDADLEEAEVRDGDADTDTDTDTDTDSDTDVAAVVPDPGCGCATSGPSPLPALLIAACVARWLSSF